MAAVIRQVDWSSTALGPIHAWPQHLRAAIDIMLNSRHPMVLAWGPSLTLLFNDAYRPILHLKGLTPEPTIGRSFRDVWPDEWPQIEPYVSAALAGQSSWSENLHTPIFRNGETDHAYFTFSYSPIHDEAGRVAGVFCAATETTRHVSALLRANESNEKLKITATATGLGLFERDLQTDQINADWRCRQNFGIYSADNFSTEMFLNALHPDDRERISRQMDALLSGHFGDHYETEYRMIGLEDGKERWIASRGKVIFNKHGEPLRLIGATRDITANKKLEKQKQQNAQHCPLTGLPNRALLFEYCEHLLAAARRSNTHCAVIFIDLDRFKPINDQYGHEIGDKVLQEVARRLDACVRMEDLVSRIGGDEFIIVLPRMQTADAPEIVAQNLIETISEPILIDDLQLHVSSSIGISLYRKDGEDLETLVRHADIAMYSAKQAGRSTYRLYSSDMANQANHKQSLETRLKKAIEAHNLQLLYQPIIDIHTGAPVGAEALLRVPTEDGMLLSPGEVIPLAESSGMISHLSEWIVQEACQQQRRWRDRGLSVTMAINVSPGEFKQKAFFSQLKKAIECSDIEPGHLQIELTEKAVLENPENGMASLTELKELGIQISLDNFGTGCFSLSHLVQLPLDRVKIDKSLVEKIGGNERGKYIADAVIALGRCFNLKVAGEGIESPVSLEYLQNHGCDQAQGFWFSQPLPASQFEAWYRERAHQAT